MDFDEKVDKQVHRLQNSSYPEIENDVTQKRIAWVLQNRPEGIWIFSPRQAFALFFFDYMGLSEEDLEVVEESDTKIIWLSRNRCPTLEACAFLKLDTRQVCREAFEKSTQAFFSMLDPYLKFQRSYDDIRPYAPYCREWIVREDPSNPSDLEPQKDG
jgi:hypothetical protein